MNKKQKVAIALIILTACALRLFFAYHQPLWLDEKYSIFFANKFSLAQLLINFNIDIHSGYFYAFVKVFLHFTQNKFLIRLATSVIPQILGILFILRYLIKNKKSFAVVFSTVFFLSFHPLILNLSWQIRMYGFVFLSTCFTYILIEKYLKNQNFKNLFFLFISLIIGNLIHYSMYILSFFVMLLLFFSHKQKHLLEKILFLTTGFIFFISEFFLTIGINNTQYFNKIRWIEKPSIDSMKLFFLQLVGLQNSLVISTLTFSLFLIAIIILRKKFTKETKKLILFLSIFPLILTLIYSISSEFLSQRFLLYKFLPNISLMLARAHLPFVTLFLILIANLTKKIKPIRLIIFLIILSLVWGKTNYYSNIIPTYNEKKQILINKISIENKAIFWPTMWHIEQINFNNYTLIPNLEKYEKSQKIDTMLYQDKTGSEKRVINLIKNETIIINNKSQNFEKKPQQKLKTTLNKYCRKTESYQSMEKWQCS